MTDQIPSIEGLKVRFSGATVGGTEVSFPPAGVTAIVGPNNSGKSTLLRELIASHQQSQVLTKVIQSARTQTLGTWNDARMWLEEHCTVIENPGSGRSYHKMGASVQETHAEHLWQQLTHVSRLDALTGFFIHYSNATAKEQVLAQSPRVPAGQPATSPMQRLFLHAATLEEVRQLAEQAFGIQLELDELGDGVFLRVGRPIAPRPAVGESKGQYHDEMAVLPLLTDQGDGLKSYLANLIPLVASTYPVVLIDEPEAYLHPPQAQRLGRELARLSLSKNIQLVVATHDKDLLAGLLDSEADVSIVRLSRDGNRTEAAQVSNQALTQMRQDPLLRYSNILDGIFHQRVIAAEGWDDCTFYRAALDHAKAEGIIASPVEVLLVPCGGKQALHKFARSIRNAGVPVVATPDLDILRERKTLQTLVEAVGGDWSTIEASYEKFTTAAGTQPLIRTNSDVMKEIGDALSDPNQDFVKQTHTTLRKIIDRDTMWPNIKSAGVAAFTGDAYAALTHLLDALDNVGVCCVREGELECFYRPESKGPQWIDQAMTNGAYKQQEVMQHIKRLLGARI